MNFDIIGVGNALVDEIYYVSKEFIDKTALNFNQFKPISFQEQERIIALLPDGEKKELVCGGSSTNSLAAASNYGSLCAHICQLGEDEMGIKYEQDLSLNNIKIVNTFKHKSFKTGRCLVFITPNSERTMGTYLGASEQLNFLDSFIDNVNSSKILFSEGYQFTSDQNYYSFTKILKNTASNVKFALSLSDPFVIQNYRKRFEEVIKIKKIDYLFCNREEAITMCGDNYSERLKEISNNFVVTNGSNESIIFDGKNESKLKALKVNAIDSNGAGDIFAGSALHKIIDGKDFVTACSFGNYASSKIVQEKSPRMSADGYKNIKNSFELLQ